MQHRTWVLIIALVLLLFVIPLLRQINSIFRLTANENTPHLETRNHNIFDKPSETDLIQQFDGETAAWIAGLTGWKAMPPFAGFTAQWDKSQPCPTCSTLADAAFFWDLPLATPEEVIPVRYWKILSCEIYHEP